MAIKKTRKPIPSARAELSAVANDSRALKQLTRAELLKTVAGAMDALLAAQRQIAELKEENTALKSQSMTCGLTGIPNRRAYDSLMDRLFNKMNRIGDEFEEKRSATQSRVEKINSITLFVIDADKFKSINDTYGHPAGDAVIKAIANEILGPSIRDNDFVARLGGDEFVIVGINMTTEGIDAILKRIETACQNTAIDMGNGAKVKIGLSCGVHTVKKGENLEKLYSTADENLTAAKTAKGTSRKVEIIQSPSPPSP